MEKKMNKWVVMLLSLLGVSLYSATLIPNMGESSRIAPNWLLGLGHNSKRLFVPPPGLIYKCNLKMLDGWAPKRILSPLILPLNVPRFQISLSPRFTPLWFHLYQTLWCTATGGGFTLAADTTSPGEALRSEPPAAHQILHSNNR